MNLTYRKALKGLSGGNVDDGDSNLNKIAICRKEDSMDTRYNR